MTKRLGNAPAPVRPAVPPIDVRRHREELAVAAATVRDLVERLTRGQTLLRQTPPDDPKRPGREQLWRSLTVRLHVALREAYARFALLRVALPHEEAMAIWEGEMPQPPVMDDIGIAHLLRYWRTRTDRPEWITTEETRRIVNLGWPPRSETDAINRGIEDFYGEAPFD
jgi:hypothetical protein